MYGQPVGNKAVQEVFSAKGYYECDLAAVVTNSSFTKSAMQLASSLDVHLLHDSEIEGFVSAYDSDISSEEYPDTRSNQSDYRKTISSYLNDHGWNTNYDESDSFNRGKYNEYLLASKGNYMLLLVCLDYSESPVTRSELGYSLPILQSALNDAQGDSSGVVISKSGFMTDALELANDFDGISLLESDGLESLEIIRA